MLLKCDADNPRTSLSIAQELGCCEMSVNDWMVRFTEQGIDGLKVAAGRGRKGILQKHSDLEAVRRAVGKSRQRISLAKAELEQELGKEFSALTLRSLCAHSAALSEKNGCRFKRLRRVTKRKPNPDIYEVKCECLAELEDLSERGLIDLYYGDESGVSLLPNVPYAGQFRDEEVSLPSERGGHLNCFALLSRDNRCFTSTTEGKVTGDWIAEQIAVFLETLCRLTVIVFDNASVHLKAAKEHAEAWEQKGLFVWFLPTYSPHLNIAEILWKKLKYEWLQATDYQDKETLHTAVRSLLDQVGKSLKIAFKPFRQPVLTGKTG